MAVSNACCILTCLFNREHEDLERRSRSRRRKGKEVDLREISHIPGTCASPIHEQTLTYGTADTYPPRQYFVLTEAGKPVFIRWVPSPLPA